jgi:hypothetical protein
MPASKQLRVLSVRLPEPDVRRFKSLAASRGVSLQDAVHQALEAWISLVPKANPEPLDSLQNSLADVDVEKIMRADKEAELAKDRRWS